MALNTDLAQWVEQSREHLCPFGETLDARARFDVEDGHNKHHPRLRRVNNPAEISSAYYEAAFDSPLVDMISALIGPT